MSPTQIVWIVAGIIVILLAAAALLTFARRRGQKRVREENEAQDRHLDGRKHGGRKPD